MSPVISIESLSKKYIIGHQQQARYSTFRDVLTNGAKRVTHKLAHPFATKDNNPTQEEFWALKDVSFDIKQGDRVGIIGRNGAGKSTLLKILSRITEPTSGRVSIRGRVASLLEVGTGFHPELTGRENIYLNGAILGMSRADMRRHFDEIVAFSEVEKFLDTPVKHYSSGMYVRLAFSVAAHLEPEILVVDEVLAVGDAQFQRKCLGKMHEAGKQGRTVLFVSHNMPAIRNLCDRAVWLNDGQVYQAGAALAVSESYLRKNLSAASLKDMQATIAALPPDPAFQLLNIVVRQSGEPSTLILNGDQIEVEITYIVQQKTVGLRIYFDLCDEESNILIRSFNDDDADNMSIVEPGHYIAQAVIPADFLAPCNYELKICGAIYNDRSIPVGGIGIRLMVENTSGINRAYPLQPIRAKLLPRIPWKTLTVNHNN